MNHENEITPYKSNQKELQRLIPNQFNVEGWKFKKKFKNSKKKKLELTMTNLLNLRMDHQNKRPHINQIERNYEV
jgi:hypothetical protein